VYTTTFYSFKGGVGRTMALVNVAVHLVNLGRNVLLVDFDLEAPGLETFPALRPRRPTPGVVDYVTSFVATGNAPAVSKFLFQVDSLQGGNGRLWIMPAGLQDGQYGQRFHRIDWERLYREREGFLLFEDLKAQWSETLRPDYVLIDSRTGHTDTGGICTRQLPDAVVILFFPNEQNLRGLETVVEETRLEARGPRKKEVKLHFVTANVPDLDDEDHILDERMGRFREVLGYEHLAATIHHYDSLSLLNQVVFAAERPRSRLSQEYQQLMREVIRYNSLDRDGALDFLRAATRRHLRSPDSSMERDLEHRVGAIEASNPDDGEILQSLAEFRREQGLLDESRGLLDRAIKARGPSVEALLARAEVNVLTQRSEDAIADAKTVLSLENVPYRPLLRAVRLLTGLEPQSLATLPDAAKLGALSATEKERLCHEFFWDRQALVRIEEVLYPLLDSPDVDEEERAGLVTEVSLSLVGQGRFQEARALLAPDRRTLLECDQIPDVFNYAVAEWGATRRQPKDLFARVVEMAKKRASEKSSANFWQCLAICHYVLGSPLRAKRALTQARKRLLERPASEFSAWRYLQVAPPEFLEDLDAIRSMVNGKRLVPLVIRSGRSRRPAPAIPPGRRGGSQKAGKRSTRTG
jgi:cellulose biosynthesis protein BcsQ